MPETEKASGGSTSFSEISTWSTCRKKWYWAYVRNIEPRNARRAPVLGSCGHEALQALLEGKSWEAGVDEWLKKELSTRELFDEEKDEYRAVAEEIKAILPKYVQHYAPLKAIAVEQEFSVPLKGSSLRLKGFFDAIVEDPDGRVWLMETKFPSQSFRSEEDIDLDAQLGIYHYAALKSGYPVVGIIYNQILGKPEKRPEVLKSRKGMSRAQVKCTWETYAETCRENGFDPAEYEEEMRPKLAGVELFRRYFRARSQTEVHNFMLDLYSRVWDMGRAKKHIYMNENRVNCSMCWFKELCLETLKGGDVETLIQLQFAPRRSRRDQPEPEVDLTELAL